MPFTCCCDGCGEQFTTRTRPRGARAFCSQECYHKATIVRPDRKCPQCGKVFRPLWRRGNSNQIYCSWDCYLASPGGLAKTCPVCSKDYTFIASGKKTIRTCTEGCAGGGTKYVDCERCGKRFRGDYLKTRRHCSEECRRPPLIVACRKCGREFRIEPSDIDHQFCSLACYRSFVGETRLEARIRVALEILGIPFEQEFPVGRWSIDFAVLRHKIAIEADGEYWHTVSAERDKRKDARLTAAGWQIVRLAETDVNAARDLPQLILGRVREVTGIDRAALVSAATASAPALVAAPAKTRPFRLRASRRPIAGQLALWDR